MHHFHEVLREAHALARAHVRALGGSALVSMHVHTFNTVVNAYKNEAYCLVALSGDAFVCRRGSGDTPAAARRLAVSLAAPR